jgi:lipopolysaccharide/colanic/teichoic acid biosynthesis glycosyltransferase
MQGMRTQPSVVSEFANIGVGSGRLYDGVKRGVDLIGGFVLLLVFLPALAIVGVVVLLDSGWPILYRGSRIGRGGRSFKVLKFRTMRSDAGDGAHRAYISELMRASTTTSSTAEIFKVPCDPRITRVGGFLRKTSIDELPQLWNVLQGEMSLVGPRPDVPYGVAAYEPWMYARLTVLPGMTGLWQVSGRSRLSLHEMLRLDVEYVERRSLWLDIRILGQTLPAVISTSDSA